MITILKGEDYTKYLHLQYADTQEPVDLTGCTAFCQMRDVPGGELLATAACEIDDSNGDIWVRFSGNVTADLPSGEAGYDIWVVENGRKHPIYMTRCRIGDAYTEEFGS